MWDGLFKTKRIRHFTQLFAVRSLVLAGFPDGELSYENPADL